MLKKDVGLINCVGPVGSSTASFISPVIDQLRAVMVCDTLEYTVFEDN